MAEALPHDVLQRMLAFVDDNQALPLSDAQPLAFRFSNVVNGRRISAAARFNVAMPPTGLASFLRAAGVPLDDDTLLRGYAIPSVHCQGDACSLSAAAWSRGRVVCTRWRAALDACAASVVSSSAWRMRRPDGMLREGVPTAWLAQARAIHIGDANLETVRRVGSPADAHAHVRLEQLQLPGSRVGPSDWHHLLSSPRFAYLRDVCLRGSEHVGDSAVAALCGAARWLDRLDIAFCGLVVPITGTDGAGGVHIDLDAIDAARSAVNSSGLRGDAITDASMHVIAGSSVTVVSIAGCRLVTDAGVAALLGGPVRELCVSSMEALDGSCLPVLMSAVRTRLTRLWMSCFGVGTARIRGVKHHMQTALHSSPAVAASPGRRGAPIQLLDMSFNAWLDDAVVAALRPLLEICSNLASLSVQGSNAMSGAAFQRVFEHCSEAARWTRSLRYLDLGQFDSLHDDDAAAIVKSCRNLRYLDLSGCTKIDRAALRSVGTACPLLKVLRTRVCVSMSGSAIAHLSAAIRHRGWHEEGEAVHPLAESASVSDSADSESESSDDDKSTAPSAVFSTSDVQSILLRARHGALASQGARAATRASATAAALTALDLWKCTEVTDASLQVLAASCTELQYLDLSGIEEDVSDEGVSAVIHANPHLQTLLLASVPVSHSILFAAAQLRKLRALDVSDNVEVSSMSLVSLLGSCASLQTLRTSGCAGVDDAVCAAASMHAQLSTLIMRGCSNSAGVDLQPGVHEWLPCCHELRAQLLEHRWVPTWPAPVSGKVSAAGLAALGAGICKERLSQLCISEIPTLCCCAYAKFAAEYLCDPRSACICVRMCRGLAMNGLRLLLHATAAAASRTRGCDGEAPLGSGSRQQLIAAIEGGVSAARGLGPVAVE